MKCIVDDCEKDAKTRGYCGGHYHRLCRYGDAEYAPPPRQISKCSIDGCDGNVAGGGYCRKHYARFRRYGDPLGGGISYGEARDFIIRVTSEPQGEECVLWPYGKNANGYGRVNWNNLPTNAHAIVAELAHGPKPTNKHEACHKCGKGHLGCVNPNHLYWGTRKENVRDAIEHGTSYSLHVPVGERHHCAKYSDELIDRAMRRISDGEKPATVAKSLEISLSYIYALSNGQSPRARAWIAANDNEPVRMAA